MIGRRPRVIGWPRLLAATLLCIASVAHAGITLTDQRGRQIELASPAQRIVSLLPSLTETVCALEACERLVGTDRHSNWPASVAALPKLGGMEDVQIERIVALKPDLVLVAVSTRAIDRLEALGLKVLALEPHNLQETRQVMETVARALGRPGSANDAWQRLQDQITAAAARVPAALRGQGVYFEVAAVPYAAGEASFIGEVLLRLGLKNIVPATLGAFPQLNPEFVLRAEPDVVMASRAAIGEMASRPGWSGLRALQLGKTCGFATPAYDLLMRPGPRLGDAALALADCLVALDRLGAAAR